MYEQKLDLFLSIRPAPDSFDNSFLDSFLFMNWIMVSIFIYYDYWVRAAICVKWQLIYVLCTVVVEKYGVCHFLQPDHCKIYRESNLQWLMIL